MINPSFVRKSVHAAWLAPLVAALFACGGGGSGSSGTPAAAPSAAAAPASTASAAPTAETAPATTAPAAATAPGGAATAWNDDLSKHAKAEIMKTRVTPALKKVFQDHDAKTFAAFSCKTCHGPNFGDPKDFLPKLTFKDGGLTAFKEKPEEAKFMHEKVVPAMADALGLHAYDPATQQGFGCGGCHGIQK